MPSSPRAVHAPPSTLSPARQKRLERAGYQVGSAADFLNLSSTTLTLIDLKLSLAHLLKQLRRAHEWTQAEVAERIGSSQSRVAKMEAADPSVSFDLMFRAALALGASREELGLAMQGEETSEERDSRPGWPVPVNSTPLAEPVPGFYNSKPDF